MLLLSVTGFSSANLGNAIRLTHLSKLSSSVSFSSFTVYCIRDVLGVLAVELESGTAVC